MSLPFLRALLEPGPYNADFWLKYTPKKLRERVPDALDGTGAAIVGWGVQVVKRPNWRAWSLLAELVLVLSLVFAVVYSAVRHDVSSAFSGAQCVIAGVAILNTVYLAALLQRT
jgi:hypothetical protein